MKQNILSYLELEKIFKIEKTVNINKNRNANYLNGNFLKKLRKIQIRHFVATYRTFL